MGREKSLKVLTVSFFLIFGFAFVEIVGGILTNSLALLSDAGHMLTDSVSLLIALIAQLIVVKAKGKSMTYGLYRLEVLAALVNGVFLIGLVGYITYEAIMRFLNPEPVKGPQMLLIAVIGLLVNLLVGYMLFKSSEDNINVKSALLHVITDTLGSVAAILSGIAVTLWKFYLADPILSLAISILILPSTYSVIKRSLNILLELVPSDLDLSEVEKKIRSVPGVVDVHDLHVWSITSGSVVLTAHVVVSEDASPEKVMVEIHTLAEDLGIRHTTVQVEKEGFPCFSVCPLLKEQQHHGHYH